MIVPYNMKRTRTLRSYFSAAPINLAPVDNQSPEIVEERGALTLETPSSRNANVEDNNSPNIQAENQDDPPIDAEQSNLPIIDDELGSDDIVVDPGLRMPIEEINPNIKDDVKREYVLLGLCQPKGHAYP